jgi:transcriptional regulator with XRE-family HTH domain
MKRNNVESVIAALKKLRVKKGISQEALARMAGVDRSYLSRLESGKVNPSYKQIEILAHALGAQLMLVIT